MCMSIYEKADQIFCNLQVKTKLIRDNFINFFKCVNIARLFYIWMLSKHYKCLFTFQLLNASCIFNNENCFIFLNMYVH